MIPEGWQRSRLGDLADIRFSNVDKKSHEDEMPVRLCNYTDVYYNSRITNQIPFMHATAKNREIEKFSIQQGDVIITKDSETPDDIAVPTYVNEQLENVLCGYHLTLLRPYEENTSGEYLGHLFNLPSVQHHFYVLANGITRFGLTSDAVTEAPIVHPSLPEQKKIAAILTSVDEAIEKQEAQIAKLQNLKKAMMQELLTKGIGHTEFKDSPVGRIPVGWEVKTLGKMGFDISDGNYSSKYPKSSDFLSQGVPFIRANNIKRLSVVWDDMRFISPEQHSDLKKGHLKEGDLLITTRGELGKVALVPTYFIGANINAQLVRINTVKHMNNRFLLNFLTTEIAAEAIGALETGTALKQLPVGKLRQLCLPIPPISEQNKITSILTSVDDNIESKLKKLAHTKSLKKALIQDLLTGKVRVNV